MTDLLVGTRVRKRRSARTGHVMPHNPEYSHGSFPVRFDDGICEVLNHSYVVVIEPDARPIKWYVRSNDQHDTHLGIMSQGRRVAAVCGIQYAPRAVLASEPPARDQICQRCQHAEDAR